MWVFVPRAQDSRSKALDGSHSALLRSVPSQHAQPAELRTLAYFRERTGPSLSDFSVFTQHMFRTIIPLLSASEDAVRSMTIALAARQELLSCAPQRLYSLSAVRSNAVASALGMLTQPSCNLVAVLLCGLLFIGYECLQDPNDIDPDTSIRHLGAGLRILEEQHIDSETRKRLPASVRDMIDNHLEPMYLQMEMMLCLFNAPIHTICDLSTYDSSDTPPALPSRFTDLVSARDHFFKIYRWQFLFRATGTKPWTPTSQAFQTVRQVFVEWHTLIMAYNDRLGDTSPDDLLREKLTTVVSHWSLLMVALIHSTVITPRHGGSPFLPDGGRLKFSVVDLTNPVFVTTTFIIDARSLGLLQIFDWTDRGLVGDPALRIWPVVEIRRLEDGSGRGMVTMKM
jgi:hypothetical protein